MMADVPVQTADLIRVWAANAELAKVLTHPSLPRTKFSEDLSQPLDWPNDQFTTRRIADGDVLLSPPGQAAQQPMDEEK